MSSASHPKLATAYWDPSYLMRSESGAQEGCEQEHRPHYHRLPAEPLRLCPTNRCWRSGSVTEVASTRDWGTYIGRPRVEPTGLDWQLRMDRSHTVLHYSISLVSGKDVNQSGDWTLRCSRARVSPAGKLAAATAAMSHGLCDDLITPSHNVDQPSSQAGWNRRGLLPLLSCPAEGPS